MFYLLCVEWCAKYKQDSQINTSELQKEIDEFMENHDNKVEEVREKIYIFLRAGKL